MIKRLPAFRPICRPMPENFPIPTTYKEPDPVIPSDPGFTSPLILYLFFFKEKYKSYHRGFTLRKANKC